MTTKVQQWGNSLALRIPRSFAKDVHLQKGASVNLSVKGGKLVIEPSRRQKFFLSALLGKIKRGNLHTEVDLGGSVGNEVW